MIRPVNNHLIIEPLKHESFIQSDKGTYQEVGVVVSMCSSIAAREHSFNKEPVLYYPAKVGDRVYFDSWLASKFPKNDKEWFWLVDWKDVKAIENEVSE